MTRCRVVVTEGDLKQENMYSFNCCSRQILPCHAQRLICLVLDVDLLLYATQIGTKKSPRSTLEVVALRNIHFGESQGFFARDCPV